MTLTQNKLLHRGLYKKKISFYLGLKNYIKKDIIKSNIKRKACLFSKHSEGIYVPIILKIDFSKLEDIDIYEFLLQERISSFPSVFGVSRSPKSLCAFLNRNGVHLFLRINEEANDKIKKESVTLMNNPH